MFNIDDKFTSLIKVLCINPSAKILTNQTETSKPLPFKIESEKLTYIMIVITKKYNTQFEANFTLHLHKLLNRELDSNILLFVWKPK